MFNYQSESLTPPEYSGMTSAIKEINPKKYYLLNSVIQSNRTSAITTCISHWNTERLL